MATPDAPVASADSPPVRTVPAQGWRIVAMFVLTALFLGAVAASLLIRGPFLWHVQQPHAWHGALEAVALVLLVWGALSWRALGAWRVALLLVPIALYLRRHHVDLVALVSLAYFEGLFALGSVVLRRRIADDTGWLRDFVAGVALFSLLLWLAQLAGYGLPRTQRLLAFAVLLPALLWQLRQLQTVQLMAAALQLRSGAERFWAAALIAAPCVLFARTNVVFDFDSVWYGFRPERVLVGENSVFDALGMVSPVHYFPKLWEVLLLPLSAAREHSLAQGGAILCGAVLARLVAMWTRDLGHSRVAALAAAALAWSIPAYSNVTLSAKPDAFAALLVVAMAWFAWTLHTRRDVTAWPWLLGCAGLAMSSKLAIVPYVAVIGVASIVAWWPQRNAPIAAREKRQGWGVFLLCAGVGVLVCSRTWWLAGMPTIGPEQLVALWTAFGLQFRPPVGTLDWVRPQQWAEVPVILFGWMFDPSRFSHLQISWPGNVWIVLPIAALLLPRGASPLPRRWPLWLVPAAGFLLLLLIGFTNKGGDGNYFLVPVVLATIAAFDLWWRRCTNPALQRAALLVTLLFVAFHGYYSLVSAGWGAGTRAWDVDFSRSNRDSGQADARALAARHLGGVADYLQNNDNRMRVLGEGGDYRLPARYEEISDLLFSHWRHEHDPQYFRRLMACAQAEAFLLPTPEEPRSHSTLIAALIDELRALPSERDLYRDEHWRLVSLRGWLPRCDL